MEGVEDPAESLDRVEQSGDFDWDEESEALRQARREAELTLSADSVRVYLKQIGKASIIRLRFGLIDGHQRTLEEVGKRFGVTRERIRQIEAKALRKLRHPSRSKRLKDYLE